MWQRAPVVQNEPWTTMFCHSQATQGEEAWQRAALSWTVKNKSGEWQVRGRIAAQSSAGGDPARPGI